MLDKKGQETLWQDLNRHWVMPEIERRKALGTFPPDFKIWKCLIRLSKDAAPIIEFNDEIEWHIKAKKPKGIAFNAGDEVYLHHIEGVEAVIHPNVVGKRVAFFYIHKTPDGFGIVFSALPNLPGCESEAENLWEWNYSDAIAESMNLEFREIAVYSA